jgi:bidirectional [NiFe] hydrogenase diaphorase subunit
VKGSDKIIAAIGDLTHLKPGETTPDSNISLLTVRCIGACGLAPAVVFDGQVSPKGTPEEAVKRIKSWM